jgi:hypothetical protein
VPAGRSRLRSRNCRPQIVRCIDEAQLVIDSGELEEFPRTMPVTTRCRVRMEHDGNALLRGENSNGSLTRAERAVHLRATEAALDAAQPALRYGGGTARRLENVVQRCLRDSTMRRRTSW